MRDGSLVEDPRLGRLKQFDQRSLAYPIGAVVPEDITKGRSHYLKYRLDQENEGSCVGHGWEHELGAFPRNHPASHDHARYIYTEAQKLDEWEGESYEGTSVLAGAKVVQREGYITEYRWAVSDDPVNDVLRALAHEGPVIAGTNWYSSMSDPRPSGLLDVEGYVAGGHCYLIRGFLLKPRLIGEGALGPVVRVTNSWGPGWGRNGECFIKLEDLERLLKEGGEACLPVGRK
jgi:hypothetical protein